MNTFKKNLTLSLGLLLTSLTLTSGASAQTAELTEPYPMPPFAVYQGNPFLTGTGRVGSTLIGPELPPTEQPELTFDYNTVVYFPAGQGAGETTQNETETNTTPTSGGTQTQGASAEVGTPSVVGGSMLGTVNNGTGPCPEDEMQDRRLSDAARYSAEGRTDALLTNEPGLHPIYGVQRRQAGDHLAEQSNTAGRLGQMLRDSQVMGINDGTEAQAQAANANTVPGWPDLKKESAEVQRIFNEIFNASLFSGPTCGTAVMNGYGGDPDPWVILDMARKRAKREAEREAERQRQETLDEYGVDMDDFEFESPLTSGDDDEDSSDEDSADEDATDAEPTGPATVDSTNDTGTTTTPDPKPAPKPGPVDLGDGGWSDEIRKTRAKMGEVMDEMTGVETSSDRYKELGKQFSRLIEDLSFQIEERESFWKTGVLQEREAPADTDDDDEEWEDDEDWEDEEEEDDRQSSLSSDGGSEGELAQAPVAAKAAAGAARSAVAPQEDALATAVRFGNWMATMMSSGPAELTAHNFNVAISSIPDVYRSAAIAVASEVLAKSKNENALDALQDYLKQRGDAPLLELQVVVARIAVLGEKGASLEALGSLHKRGGELLARLEGGPHPASVTDVYSSTLAAVGTVLAKKHKEHANNAIAGVDKVAAIFEIGRVVRTKDVNKALTVIAIGRRLLGTDLDAESKTKLTAKLDALGATVQAQLDRRITGLRTSVAGLEGTIRTGKRDGMSLEKTGHAGLGDEIAGRRDQLAKIRNFTSSRAMFDMLKLPREKWGYHIEALVSKADQATARYKWEVKQQFSGLRDFSKDNRIRYELFEQSLGRLDTLRTSADSLRDLGVRYGARTLDAELEKIHLDLNGTGLRNARTRYINYGLRGQLKNANNSRRMSDLPFQEKDEEILRDRLMLENEIGHLEVRRVQMIWDAPGMKLSDRRVKLEAKLTREARLYKARGMNVPEYVTMFTGKGEEDIARAEATYGAIAGMKERWRVSDYYANYVAGRKKGNVQKSFEATISVLQAQIDAQLNKYTGYLNAHGNTSLLDLGYLKYIWVQGTHKETLDGFTLLYTEAAQLQDALTKAAFHSSDKLSVSQRAILRAWGLLDKNGKYQLNEDLNVRIALAQAHQTSVAALTAGDRKMLEKRGYVKDGVLVLPKGHKAPVTTLGDDNAREFAIDQVTNLRQFGMLALTVAVPGGISANAARGALGSGVVFKEAVAKGLTLGGLRAAASGATRWGGERAIEAGLFTGLNRTARTVISPMDALKMDWSASGLAKEYGSNLAIIASLHMGSAGITALGQRLANGLRMAEEGALRTGLVGGTRIAGEVEILTQLDGALHGNTITQDSRLANLSLILQLRALHGLAAKGPKGKVGEYGETMRRYWEHMDGRAGERPAAGPVIESPLPTIEGPKRLARANADDLIPREKGAVHTLRATYGEMAARAFQMAVEAFGGLVDGVAGSYATGRARQGEWPGSYEDAMVLDKLPTPLPPEVIKGLPENVRALYELKLAAGEKGLPSDMDIPVRVDDPVRLMEVAKKIFDETGIYIEFVPVTAEVRPNIDVAAMKSDARSEAATKRLGADSGRDSGADTLKMGAGGSTPPPNGPTGRLNGPAEPNGKRNHDNSYDPYEDLVETLEDLGPVSAERAADPTYAENQALLANLRTAADSSSAGARDAARKFTDENVWLDKLLVKYSKHVTEWTPEMEAQFQRTKELAKEEFGWGEEQVLEELGMWSDFMLPADKVDALGRLQSALMNDLLYDRVPMSDAQAAMERQVALARHAGITELAIQRVLRGFEWRPLGARIDAARTMHDALLLRGGARVIVSEQVAVELRAAITRVLADELLPEGGQPAAGAAEAAVLRAHAEAAAAEGVDFWGELPRTGVYEPGSTGDGFSSFLLGPSAVEALQRFLADSFAPYAEPLRPELLELYSAPHVEPTVFDMPVTSHPGR